MSAGEQESGSIYIVLAVLTGIISLFIIYVGYYVLTPAWNAVANTITGIFLVIDPGLGPLAGQLDFLLASVFIVLFVFVIVYMFMSAIRREPDPF